MCIIEKIHYRETEVIRIRSTYSADIENSGDYENSAKIARNNCAAQFIKDDRTFSRVVGGKLVRSRENVVEKEILHRKRNRTTGIRLGLNDKIEIGALSELGENYHGRRSPTGQPRGLA